MHRFCFSGLYRLKWWVYRRKNDFIGDIGRFIGENQELSVTRQYIRATYSKPALHRAVFQKIQP
jgi:hypothetical protein